MGVVLAGNWVIIGWFFGREISPFYEGIVLAAGYMNRRLVADPEVERTVSQLENNTP